MLVSVQRVRASGHAIGLNTFMYSHGDVAWPTASAEAFRLSATLVQAWHEIPGGGNVVLSYLDLVAPDGTGRGRLLDILRESLDAITRAGGPLPVPGCDGLDYALKWQMVPALLPQWVHEVKELMRRVVLP